MKTLKLKITGMHCSSCEKLIKKNLSKVKHIKDIDLSYNNEIATIHYNPEINTNVIIDVIRSIGYDAVVVDKDYISDEINFKKYLKSLKLKNTLEGELIGVVLGTFIFLSLLEIIAYYSFFKDIPEFFGRYGYYIVFLIISIVISGTSVWHIKAYGNNFSCMSGMMIGMTSGMISGFLIGLLVGATNGMFVGSIIGILVGIFIGVYTGNCCGIMGIMEGMTAGLMGGLMGAMTSLMMINDNLKLIVPVIVIISSIILIGLDYMIYKDVRNIKEKINKYNFITFTSICFVITIGITFLMIYGPKSFIFQ